MLYNHEAQLSQGNGRKRVEEHNLAKHMERMELPTQAQ